MGEGFGGGVDHFRCWNDASHRMCASSRWAAKNRLSFLLGPEADQLVIFFRSRLSGHCLLFAEVYRPHLPLPTFRCKPHPVPTTRWLLADLLVTLLPEPSAPSTPPSSPPLCGTALTHPIHPSSHSLSCNAHTNIQSRCHG